MKFGEIAAVEAEGAILAHSLRLGSAAALKKGRVLSAADIERLKVAAAGIERIVAARLDPGDIREDAAAARIAAAAAGPNITTAAAFTGRANLFAATKGLLIFDRDRLDRLNSVDEAVTLGTLPPFAVVEPRYKWSRRSRSFPSPCRRKRRSQRPPPLPQMKGGKAIAARRRLRAAAGSR